MSNYRDNEGIDDLRQRLYERGRDPQPESKPELKEEEVVPVVHSWDVKRKPEEMSETEPRLPKSLGSHHETSPQTILEVETETAPIMTDLAMPKKKKIGYRIKILLVSLTCFLLAVLVASILLVSETNTISGENIRVELKGPLTIGGGEVLSLEVGVTNDNAVPIEAATLIVEYPPGTQSATEPGRELFVERLSLEAIPAGETFRVPVRALVFGEENQERTINTVVEYRVRGSNATFVKQADPLSFKITSSPAVVSAEAVKKVSSGQEFTVEVKITSNSTSPLKEILVLAEYPSAFDFSEASPEPNAGNNSWLIDSLEPEEEVVIKITGLVTGNETDEYAMHFSAGVPNERDQFTLASVFGTARTDFEIERPFIALGAKVNSSDKDVVTISPQSDVDIDIKIENTLESTIYDGVVEVKLGGNALNDIEVEASDGFYDSANKTVRFEQSTHSVFRVCDRVKRPISPCALSLESEVARTPNITLSIDVRAKRLRDSDVSGELLGSITKEVRVDTAATLRSEVSYSLAVALGEGPVPPVAETKTTYLVTWQVESTTNELGEIEVAATLPPYVSYEDKITGAGGLSYNTTTRELLWNTNSVEAGGAASVTFKLGFLPSRSQIDTTPTLVGSQRLRATDKYTGSVLRATAPALTSELSSEAGFGEDSGRVVDR